MERPLAIGKTRERQEKQNSDVPQQSTEPARGTSLFWFHGAAPGKGASCAPCQRLVRSTQPNLRCKSLNTYVIHGMLRCNDTSTIKRRFITFFHWTIIRVAIGHRNRYKRNYDPSNQCRKTKLP